MQVKYFRSYVLYFFCYSLIFIALSNSLFLTVLARDQGLLDKRHLQDAETFRQQYFYYDQSHRIDPDKVDAIIVRLKHEFEDLTHTMYESKIIDKMEMEVKTLNSAKKIARKQLSEEKNELLFAFNNYLLPKLKKIKYWAQQAQLSSNFKLADSKAQGELDNFIKVYQLFYIPSSKTSMSRNAWGSDYNHPHFIKHLGGYHYERESVSYVSAVNLVAPAIQDKTFYRCLGSSIKIKKGDYLNPVQLKALKACKYDLSLLNPGSSPYWQSVTSAKRRDIINTRQYEHLFPHEGDEVTYKRMVYSGKRSPKFIANFCRNGKKIKIKIKTGPEVHSEIASGYLAQFVGFNQDIVRNYRKVKLFLGKNSYEHFISMYSRFYPQTNLSRIVSEYGNDNGQEWIILKDVSIESYSDNEKRLGPYDFEGWDLPNRREHRAELLWLAWLSVADAKSSNYKMLLKKDQKGNWHPLYRLHDPGYSLDRSLVIRSPSDIVKIISTSDRSVNIFSSSFMKWDDKKIHLYWSDLVFKNGRRYVTTTYDDLKWMARKIAAISEQDIVFALKTSNMPDDVVDLYYHKIRLRRNEIIKAFYLQDEFKLFEVPNLKKYSPNSNIKKGKIVKTHYEGHNEYESPRTNLFFLLLERIGVTLPLIGLTDKFKFKVRDLFTETTIQPLHIAENSFIPGLKIILGRRVSSNEQRWNANGSGHGYVVEDKLGIELGASCDYLHKIRSYLPFSLKAHLKNMRIEFRLVHYADSRLKGFSKEFKLLSFIRNLNDSIVYKLSPGDVFSRQDFYGFDLDINVSIHNPGYEVLNNELEITAKHFKTAPIHFFRDHFGQLHFYKEKNKYYAVGGKLNLLQFDLSVMAFPLIGMEFKKETADIDAKMFSFKLPHYDDKSSGLTAEVKRKESSLLSNLNLKRSFESLNNLITQNYDDPMLMLQRNMQLKASLKSYAHKFGVLFIGNKRTNSGTGKINVTTADGKQHYFNRYFIKKSLYHGFDKVPIKNNEDILIPKGGLNKVEVELSRGNISDVGVHIKVQNYLRKTNRKNLLKFIDRINHLFSKNYSNKFYCGFNLPPSSQIDIYRKIYADTKINISEHGINERLFKLDVEKLYQMAVGYYKEKVPLHALKLKRRFKKVLHYKDDIDKLPKVLGKFFITMDIPKYGISLLKKLLGIDNMHVYGQIYGVYRSYSMLQRNSPRAGLRFAACNWGNFSHLSPLQKFLKKYSILPFNSFVRYGWNEKQVFGDLPLPRPPMY